MGLQTWKNGSDGKMSRSQAEKKVLEGYREYNKIQPIVSDVDLQIKELIDSSLL